jgi:membrane fusion protein (multidrug efflux system)
MKALTPLLLLVPVLLLVLCGCKKKPEPAASGSALRVQTVEVTKVERRDMEDTLRLTGSLEANESAEVRAEISGILKSVAFEEGQPVNENATLAQIDERELTALRDETDARYNLAITVRDRNAGLIKTNAISRADLDSSEAEVTRLKAGLTLLDVRLAKMVIKAPFGGVAGARHVSPGDFVSPETIITQVDDLSRLKVSFAVPERYYEKLKKGGVFKVFTATLKDAAGKPAPVAGEIYFVSESIDRSTRSAPVKGFIDKPPTTLKPGMFATIELVLAEKKQVLSVPEGAILASARGTSVVAVREKDGAATADFVPVKTGLRQLGFVEVTSVSPDALTDATKVVASGVGALVLFPGAALKPVPPKTGIEKQGSRL